MLPLHHLAIKVWADNSFEINLAQTLHFSDFHLKIAVMTNITVTNIAKSTDHRKDATKKFSFTAKDVAYYNSCFNKCLKSYKRKTPTYLTISKDILLYFLKHNKIAEFRLYLTIKRDFSGKVGPSHRKLLASKMQISENYLTKLTYSLSKLGLLEHRSQGWITIVGVKRWNLRHGIMHPTVFEVPPSALENTSNLRTFCRAVQMTLAGKKAKATIQGKKRERPVPSSTPLSSSYIANHSGLSVRTIKRQKSKAQKLNFVQFTPKFRILETGTAKSIPVWQENRSNNRHVVRNIAGHWCLCEQLPSELTTFVENHKVKLSYSQQEKEAIKATFSHKNLIPEKRRRELAKMTSLPHISSFSSNLAGIRKELPFLG